jgi:RNA polymerase sigma factor (sigma-70 family)
VGAARAIESRVRWCAAKLGAAEDIDVDGLVQDVMERLIRVRNTLPSGRCVPAWLSATTRNRVYDLWRKRTRGLPTELWEYRMQPLVVFDGESELDWRIAEARVRAAIQTLDPLLKRCVLLQMHDVSIREIAHALNAEGLTVRGHPITDANVKNWLHKARQTLQRDLGSTART